MNDITPLLCTSIRRGIATVLVSVSVAATASAQPTGGIEGSVVDANGNALPGVVVTVTGPGIREEQVTGADGLYAVTGLAVGGYRVTAILPGFETVDFPVAVEANATAMVPIVLQIARLLETGQRRRRGAPHLRAQRRRRADDDAAVQHHRRHVGGGQPPRRVRAGGRRVRLRRLVEQRRRARFPGNDQRGADRHDHRRLPERHVRLLERLKGEPVHRPDEPRRRRGLAGDGRHRLAVGRGGWAARSTT